LYDRPHSVPAYRTAPMQGPVFSSTDLLGDLKKLLASADLCSKHWIWDQYDYQVRTNTLTIPERAEAAVVRIKETGTSVAMSLDGNGRYCYLDPYEGTMLIIAECCRNLSTVGALPVAATNNLNFGNPERPEIMRQLVDSLRGMGDACRAFETPITGGNASLYNETLGEGIFPTPVMGIVGLLPTEKPVGIQFPRAGLDVILLGGLGSSDHQRFGGTQYAKVVLDTLWGLPPALDVEYEKRVQAAIREVVRAGLAESAHDLSDGGLGVALAESSFGGVGASVKLETPLVPEFALFHEGPSRILLSTARLPEIAAIAAKHDVPVTRLGKTIDGRLKIDGLVDCEIEELNRTWRNAFEEMLHAG